MSLAMGVLSNPTFEMSIPERKEWSHESDWGGRVVVHRGETPRMYALAGTFARSYRIPRDRLCRVDGQAPIEGKAGNDGPRTHLVLGFEQVPRRVGGLGRRRACEGFARRVSQPD